MASAIGEKSQISLELTRAVKTLKNTTSTSFSARLISFQYDIHNKESPTSYSKIIIRSSYLLRKSAT